MKFFIVSENDLTKTQVQNLEHEERVSFDEDEILEISGLSQIEISKGNTKLNLKMAKVLAPFIEFLLTYEGD